MKKLITLAVIVATLFTLVSCKLLSKDEAQAKEEPGEPERPNIVTKLQEDNRKMKNAMIFLANKQNYSEDMLNAVQIPKIKMALALQCFLQCDSGMLKYIGIPGCGLSKEDLEEAAGKIKNLACVPLEVNVPVKEQRQQITSGVEGFDETLSQMVVCYRDQGELVFHIKNKEIIEVFE
ncbi:hypothetical protein KKI24_28995 [bacterium]|nr:hypothetical protein [bacterium]